MRIQVHQACQVDQVCEKDTSSEHFLWLSAKFVASSFDIVAFKPFSAIFWFNVLFNILNILDMNFHYKYFISFEIDNGKIAKGNLKSHSFIRITAGDSSVQP